MNTAELIYQEAQTLPDNLRAEVLDFIGFLKARHSLATESRDKSAKVTELEQVFAPYVRDLGGFKFNRDEANER